MLFYKVNLEGTEDDIQSMIKILSGYDDRILSMNKATEYDFSEDENPNISNVEEVELIAQDLTSNVPNSKFTIVGTVENHDEYMDFELVYDSRKLTKRISDWYFSYYICKQNFKDYEEFCNNTDLGDRVTQEQFNEWLQEECEIAVVDNGDGLVYKKAPLSKPYELSTQELGKCPVCGEQLDHITPIIKTSDGKMYHIWCAEGAGIDGEMV